MTNQATLQTAPACRILGVSKSGYYDWLARVPSKRAINDTVLCERIKTIHQMSQASYGVPRVTKELCDTGTRVNKKRIERLMCQLKIQGISRRRSWTLTTQREAGSRAAPDLVKRQFCADAPNQLWVADMTYIPTWAGFIYLAVVMDVYSRKVVGWSMSTRMTSEMVLGALNQALMQRRAQGVIHHSDQGSQYTSTVFGKRCQQMQVKPSMGTVGDAYDNAMAESFFATLEHELLARCTFRTHADARLALFKWIEAWYNPKRRHSGIGLVSPVQFEQDYERSMQRARMKAKEDELPTAALRSSQATPTAVDNSALWLLERASV